MEDETTSVVAGDEATATHQFGSAGLFDVQATAVFGGGEGVFSEVDGLVSFEAEPVSVLVGHRPVEDSRFETEYQHALTTSGSVPAVPIRCENLRSMKRLWR